MLRALLLFLLLTAAVAAEELPVLCYHQVCPKPSNIMETTPELFRAQLDFLKHEHYEPVSLEQAAAFLGNAGVKRPKKPILITFDDGYDGVYKYAFPELKKRKFHATVFLVVAQIGRPKPTPHLTEAQIVEMHKSKLIDFGSHTYDRHIPIPETMAEGKLSQYGLLKDLIRSREVLQKLLGGCRVSSLAWPYGHYDEKSLQVAKQAGFRLVFTTDYGRNLPGSGTYKIRRIRLSSEHDTVEVLRDKLALGG